jgi:adenylate cyclase
MLILHKEIKFRLSLFIFSLIIYYLWHMSKKILLFFFLANIFDQSFCATKDREAIDLLLSILVSGKEDTAKVNALNALGNKFLIENPDTAIYFASKALTLSTKLNYEMGIAKGYLNICIALVNRGNYDEALKRSKDALLFYDRLLISEKSSAKIKVLNQKALIYNIIGEIYLFKGNYETALINYFAALKIAEENGDAQCFATVSNNIGEIYAIKKKYNEAFHYLNKGLFHAKKIGSLKDICESYKGLAMLDSILGRYQESLENYKLYITTRDSIFKKENSQKQWQSEMQYEFDKRKLTDSLANEQEKIKVDLSFIETLQRKNNERNIFLFTGLAILIIAGGLWSRLRYIRRSAALIKQEKERSENLLLNILPAEIARELKEKGKADAKDFEEVSVLFTDFEDFSGTSEKLSSKELVAEIHACFEAFDGIIGKYRLEKIKTIGDSYMAAGGLPIHFPESVKHTVKAGLEMQEFMIRHKAEREAQGHPSFEMRVGIHTGPVIAGIVGVKKFQYDIWGNAVNIANRMEKSGEIRKVNISQTTYEFIKDDTDFGFEYRGKIEAKHKGELDMYFVSKRSQHESK